MKKYIITGLMSVFAFSLCLEHDEFSSSDDEDAPQGLHNERTPQDLHDEKIRTTRKFVESAYGEIKQIRESEASLASRREQLWSIKDKANGYKNFVLGDGGMVHRLNTVIQKCNDTINGIFQ